MAIRTFLKENKNIVRCKYNGLRGKALTKYNSVQSSTVLRYNTLKRTASSGYSDLQKDFFSKYNRFHQRLISKIRSQREKLQALIQVTENTSINNKSAMDIALNTTLTSELKEAIKEAIDIKENNSTNAQNIEDFKGRSLRSFEELKVLDQNSEELNTKIHSFPKENNDNLNIKKIKDLKIFDPEFTNTQVNSSSSSPRLIKLIINEGKIIERVYLKSNGEKFYR